jgi:hypothetical protein
MARTTAAEIKLIIDVDDANIPDLTPFITVANELVTELCVDSGYTATRLNLIETWLAAHFYAIRDPRTTSEKAGSVSANYQSKVDLNLSLTHYGQQAMLLDTDGNLAALNASVVNGGKRTVGVTWLGTAATDE